MDLTTRMDSEDIELNKESFNRDIVFVYIKKVKLYRKHSKASISSNGREFQKSKALK